MSAVKKLYPTKDLERMKSGLLAGVPPSKLAVTLKDDHSIVITADTLLRSFHDGRIPCTSKERDQIQAYINRRRRGTCKKKLANTAQGPVFARKDVAVTSEEIELLEFDAQLLKHRPKCLLDPGNCYSVSAVNEAGTILEYCRRPSVCQLFGNWTQLPSRLQAFGGITMNSCLLHTYRLIKEDERRVFMETLRLEVHARAA